MKIKKIVALAVSMAMLTGCSAVFDEYADGTYEEEAPTGEAEFSSTSEKTSLSYGTGLEEISITAQEDPDPDRQIQRRRTSVRQIRGVDVNGSLFQTTFIFTAGCFPEHTNRHTTRYIQRCITAARLSI